MPQPFTASAARARFTWLWQPVDNAPLVVFRVLFGLLLVLESAGAIVTGWVEKNFIKPTVHFPFIGFEWLQPLPGNGMYYYYAIMAVLGLGVLLGCFYRLSLGLFTLLWWSSYLMQKISYNNHYYLLLLLCFLMLVVPAHVYFSLDARRKPSLKSLSCPRWCLLIFVAQIAIVYTYAALAKLHPDWLAGWPLSIFLAAKANVWPIYGLAAQPWFTFALVYGGIAFDLLITPLLLWRRTRLFAFVLAVLFHGFNTAVFHIGIFPYLALSLCLFFFPADSVRKLFLRRKYALTNSEPHLLLTLSTFQKSLFAVLGLYFLVQILLPLRPYFFPGNANWTEEGHRMSWRMMLRSKSGHATFHVIADGDSILVDPAQYLTPKQAAKVATHPDLCWQFSQFLAKEYQRKGYQTVKVYAHTQVSLNGRPWQPLIDSTVNLSATPWQPNVSSRWVTPLQK